MAVATATAVIVLLGDSERSVFMRAVRWVRAIYFFCHKHFLTLLLLAILLVFSCCSFSCCLFSFSVCCQSIKPFCSVSQVPLKMRDNMLLPHAVTLQHAHECSTVPLS